MNTKAQPSPVKFLKEVRVELGKVQWPTRDEAIKLTCVVIAVSLAMAVFLGSIDALLLKLTETFLR